jgi:hypothetical protein
VGRLIKAITALPRSCYYRGMVTMNDFRKELNASRRAPGITKRLWEIKDVVDMLEAWEATRERL